ncbi:MAG TPA: hypothetical protein VN947_11800 [Polyangia bacterium]|nr:hypothetical protein [Polyangia bacterium]
MAKPRPRRLLLQCRDEREATLCEAIAFAFARDAGLRGIDVWHVAACAVTLGNHLLARGGGDLELRVVDEPQPAIELLASDDGPPLAGLSEELRAATRYAAEVQLAPAHPRDGTIAVARVWLRGGN